MKVTSMKFYRRKNRRGCIETLIRVEYKTVNNCGLYAIAYSMQNPSDIEDEYIGQKTAVKNLLEKSWGNGAREILQDYFDVHYPDPCAVPKGFVFRKFNKLFEKSAKEIIRQEGYCDDINCPDCPLLVDWEFYFPS